MLLDITGTGLENKGGQLMMQAVVRRLGEHGATFAMNPRVDAAPSELVPLGVRPLFPPTSNGRSGTFWWQLPMANLLSKALPASVARLYDALPRHTTVGMVDVSGYAFGDFFSAGNIVTITRRARFYKKRGMPVVFMPQMFGPFEKPKTAEAMRKLLPVPDLIYVRDAVSHAYLEKLIGSAGLPKHVRRAPDITIFEQPSDQEHAAAADVVPSGFVGLVPNVRMLDKGGPAWSEIYVDRLVAAGRAALDAGSEVRLIVHEQHGPDADIAAEIGRRLDGQCGEPIAEDSPLKLKAIIGRANVIVASRFHSIVAALSSAVPALTLGWSHKYDELLSDFGVPELMVRAEDPESSLVEHVRQLADDGERRGQTVQTLKDRKAAMKLDADQMWNDVAKQLGLS
ncbi:MAG: polysaccharide pyruvyl transferase family protein [Planctomycetota bacterium]